MVLTLQHPMLVRCLWATMDPMGLWDSRRLWPKSVISWPTAVPPVWVVSLSTLSVSVTIDFHQTGLLALCPTSNLEDQWIVLSLASTLWPVRHGWTLPGYCAPAGIPLGSLRHASPQTTTRWRSAVKWQTTYRYTANYLSFSRSQVMHGHRDSWLNMRVVRADFEVSDCYIINVSDCTSETKWIPRIVHALNLFYHMWDIPTTRQ